MVTAHNQYCQYNKCLKHIITTIIKKKPNLKFNKKDSKKILKCLTTRDHENNHRKNNKNILKNNNLKKLFNQNVFNKTTNTK